MRKSMRSLKAASTTVKRHIKQHDSLKSNKHVDKIRVVQGAELLKEKTLKSKPRSPKRAAGPVASSRSRLHRALGLGDVWV